jgi:hypothetical protein
LEVHWGAEVVVDGKEHGRFAWVGFAEANRHCQPAELAGSFMTGCEASGFRRPRPNPRANPTNGTAQQATKPHAQDRLLTCGIAAECLRRRQARNGIETFITSVPGGLPLTWSEAIFSDAPAVLDILRLPEVRDALLTQ